MRTNHNYLFILTHLKKSGEKNNCVCGSQIIVPYTLDCNFGEDHFSQKSILIPYDNVCLGLLRMLEAQGTHS